MAKPILVANWKNYPNSLPEAQSLLKNLAKKKLLYKKLTLFIAPPLTYLDLVSRSAKSFSQLASQDLGLREKGATTGSITPEILKSFGVRLVILGHSERRALGESSIQVAQKIKVALKAGMTPLICVGEAARDTEGEHFEFLRDELKATLSGLGKKEAEKILLAYEPVWAIGKQAKEALTPDELSQTVIFLKKLLSDLFGRKVAEKIPILYGGAVEESDAEGLAHVSGVRGFLVGHASLSAKGFQAIAQAIISK